MSEDRPDIFVSYSHDSDEHAKKVRQLVVALTRDGCDCRLDVHKDSDEDWPLWMTRQLREAEFVVCICTETYQRRFDDAEEPSEGKGVGWEASLIRKELYEQKGHNTRILPAVMDSGDTESIPFLLKGGDYFRLIDTDGYEKLLRRLHKTPAFALPNPGPKPDALATHVDTPLFPRIDASAKSDDNDANEFTIKLDWDRSAFNNHVGETFTMGLAQCVGVAKDCIEINLGTAHQVYLTCRLFDRPALERFQQQVDSDSPELRPFQDQWKVESIEFANRTESDTEIAERIRSRVSVILAQRPTAAKYLAEKLALEESTTSEIEVFAGQLLRCSLADFLPTVISRFTKHDDETSVVLRELAMYVIPQIFRKELRREIGMRMKTENFVEIPASHKSIVELVITGANGHKLGFEDDWKSDASMPVGKFQIEPGSEFGILQGDELKRFVKAFESAIVRKLGAGFINQFTTVARAGAIREELAIRRAGEHGRPPSRYYFIYPEGHDRVPELESTYADVVFVEHRPTSYDKTEHNVVRSIRKMFCPDDEDFEV